MKLIAPDYYARFRCLAGACRHTCCAGWEIDIDEASLARYRQVSGDMGARLRAQIEEDAEGAHFRLGEGERCPFLDRDGLCDLILTLGEDSLCQICADHPRFRSFWSDRTEIGLGLCCEAAAQLILSQDAPSRLVVLSEDGGAETCWEEDALLLSTRDALIALAQDRTKPMQARVADICAQMGLTRLLSQPMRAWAALYRKLEQLDPAWPRELDRLENDAPPLGDAWDTPLEQLLVYFLYRHVAGAAEDGDVRGHTAFAVTSWLVVRAICASRAAEGGSTLDTMADAARMYSAEIEYSDENVQRVIDAAMDVADA